MSEPRKEPKHVKALIKKHSKKTPPPAVPPPPHGGHAKPSLLRRLLGR
jgi:hypothetical protein